MLVKDCMTPNPITVRPEDDVKSVFDSLRKHGFRQFPVVKDGSLVGIVTDRDLRVTVVLEDHLIVADVMSSNPVTVSEDITLEEAAQVIRTHKFNALPVMSKRGELVGIITVTDTLDCLLNLLGFHKKPVRVKVKISEGIDIYEVFKLFQVTSEKVVSFSSSPEGPDVFYFWLIDCDVEKLDRELREKNLNIDITYFGEPKP